MRRNLKQNKLGSNECIVIYEKGSRGIILGVHMSIMEYDDLESIANHAGNTGRKSLSKLLKGEIKSSFSHHYNKKIVARIKNIEKAKI